MKDIINYFNNNAFVGSVITLVLTTFINIIINFIERRLNRKDIAKDRLREERLNKGEFRVDKYFKGNFNDSMSLVYTDYEIVKYDNGNYDCVYNKKLLDNRNIEGIGLPLRNIGNKEICEMYISVCDKYRCSLIEKDVIKNAVKYKYANYVVGYYNKILPGESIYVVLSYYKGSKVFKPFSAELMIYYRDGYGNFYEQPLFLGEERVEGAYILSSDEYVKKTSLSSYLN